MPIRQLYASCIYNFGRLYDESREQTADCLVAKGMVGRIKMKEELQLLVNWDSQTGASGSTPTQQSLDDMLRLVPVLRRPIERHLKTLSVILDILITAIQDLKRGPKLMENAKPDLDPEIRAAILAMEQRVTGTNALVRFNCYFNCLVDEIRNLYAHNKMLAGHSPVYSKLQIFHPTKEGPQFDLRQSEAVSFLTVNDKERDWVLGGVIR